MADTNKKDLDLIRRVILETIQEELGSIHNNGSSRSLDEGTIESTVVDPLLSAMKKKDIEQVKKIYQMSLDQYSSEEIGEEIAKRISFEKDRQNQVVLNAMKAQYANNKSRPSAQARAIKAAEGEMEMKRNQAAVAGGARQASLPSAKVVSGAGIQPAGHDLRQLAEALAKGTKTLQEEEVRTIISGMIKELIAGAKQVTSQGMDNRLKTTVAVQNAKAAQLRAAAQAAANAKKQAATPPPVPPKELSPNDVTPDYAADVAVAGKKAPPPVPGQKKMVAETTEMFIKNLVRAVLLSEMKKAK